MKEKKLPKKKTIKTIVAFNFVQFNFCSTYVSGLLYQAVLVQCDSNVI